MSKRRIDIWNERSEEEAQVLEQETETFVRNINQNPAGISAEKEKFIHGMKTNCHKVLPPNKKME